MLYLIDKIIRFQAGRWLKNVSAQHVWDQLLSCWNDIYLRPSDFVTANVSKQFIARAFKHYAANIDIIVKSALIEVYHSIGIVECYHRSL